MCKDKGIIFSVFSLAEAYLLQYATPMENYYILRLGKELRRNLKLFRDGLYKQYGEPSLLTLEACIILGPVDKQDTLPFVDCPPLPLTTLDTTSYKNGHLHLPIPGTPFAQIRKQLGTDYPYDGVYLGEIETTLSVDPIIIKDLSLAMLSIQREGALITWNVSLEKHLDSGRHH
ncbi:hypothetical protein DYP60_06120 [Sphaerochaeta halotolerans]|uniref:Uncharacterized protein n=2 Tax=Sphaerochaeta halotolerans TaxID=2293840 RepID=A0A372MHD7_9SPIR|nr:hypothetical protein [Sphaerochaeta sp.]RFU95199.1 hypothetical protein DYP60_06120 [Sphaerochaeta halotolerans]